MSRRNTRRTATRRRSNRSIKSRFSIGRQLHRQLRLEPLENRRLLTITVTTLADTVNFNDGLTSLREAIFAANTVPGPDTIDFAPTLTAAGPATILLTQGELKITDSLTINGPGADLLIVDASGNDPTPEVNDRKGSRVLLVDDGAAATLTTNTISGLRLTGGDIYGSGGAIFSTENLTIAKSVVTGNAINGDGQGYGGGIFVGRRQGSAAPRLVVQESEISGNFTNRNGAGIAVNGVNLEVIASRIEGNIARDQGGALWASGGSVRLSDINVYQNSAGSGAGLYRRSGSTTIASSTFQSNIGQSTGAISNEFGELEITDSSFRYNSAEIGSGGAIYNRLSNLRVYSSLIRNNSAQSNGGGVYGPALIANSEVSGNVAGDNGGGIFTDSLKITGSLVHYNRARASGGGIYSTYGELSVLNCTISNNVAEKGGGVYRFLALSNALIHSSTIDSNFAEVGGGVYAVIMYERVVRFEFSSVVRNSALTMGGGIVALGNGLQLNHTSLVHNSSAFFGSNLTGLLGTTIDASYCVIGENSQSGFEETLPGESDVNGNIVGGPIYGQIPFYFREVQIPGPPIWENPLTVLIPEPENPGINAGDPAAVSGQGGVPLHDQRGAPYTRIFGGRIDIGAAESVPASFLPGDYCLDGVVDAMDYSVWRDTLGAVVPPGTGADGNGDGVVDQRDFDVWKSNFGAAASLATVTGQPQHNTPSAMVSLVNHVASAEQQSLALGPILVTTLADTVDFNDGLTSLREAIFAANTVPGADTIDFAPALTAAGPATILLTRGELKITDSLTINGPGADLLTIDASGNDPTPDSTPLDSNFGDDADGSRILNIDDGISGNLTSNAISGLRLTGGDRTYNGGAISSLENLTLDTVVITGNSIISDFGGSGGGVFIGTTRNSPKPQLIITNSVISGNYASRGGGAIGGQYASVSVVGSALEENHGRRGGGALDVFSGSLSISATLLRANVGRLGGAIRSMDENSVIDNCDIAENSSYSGGGVYSDGKLLVTDSRLVQNKAIDGPGGALAGENMTILRSEIRENYSNRRGGGIYGSANVERSSIVDNTAEGSGGGIYGFDLRISKSLLSGNLAYGAGGGIGSDVGDLEIVDSSLHGNASRQWGGAIYHNAGYGSGDLVIRSTTIAGNNSSFGGGLYIRGNEFAQSRIEFSTIVRNGATVGGGAYLIGPNLALFNTIVADNQATIGQDLTGLIGTEYALHYSLLGNNSSSGLSETPIGAADANGNVIGGPIHGPIDPMLQQAWHGSTPAVPNGLILFFPNSASPVVDAGDPAAVPGQSGVPVHEQRGAPFTRVYGGRIDIGAVESIPAGFLPGDYFVDGVVDARDYTVWRDTLGADVSPGAGADGNGDGVVDQRDFDVWKSNFGATATQLEAASADQGAITKAIAASELSPAKPKTLGQSRKLARALAHATQPPALPGVRAGIDRNHSQNFLPRDQALDAWLANRRPAILHDSKTDADCIARHTHKNAANLIDAALEILDHDRGFAHRRGLQVVH